MRLARHVNILTCLVMSYLDKNVLFVDSRVGAIALLAAYFTASLLLGLEKEATASGIWKQSCRVKLRNVLSIAFSISIMETVSSIKLDRNQVG